MSRLLQAALFAVVVVLGLSWGSAYAVMGLHLVPNPDAKGYIPPNGSEWHELYPNFCNTFTQQEYIDNGDGRVSVCDYIVLTNALGGNWRYHVEDVAVTYKVRYSEGSNPIAYMESYTPPDQNPVGQCWHIVYPPESFCTMKRVNSWSDGNGNCRVDVCDNLTFGECSPNADKEEPLCHWHIEEVSLDIRVGDGTAAEADAWGKIKALFNTVF